MRYRAPVLASVVVVFFSACEGKATPSRSNSSAPASAAVQSVASASRKDELALEGVINDLCYRLSVKGELLNVQCYANVSLKDVIVYLYPTRGANRAESLLEARYVSERLAKMVHDQFLDFPDWSWARDYKVSVVNRVND